MSECAAVGHSMALSVNASANGAKARPDDHAVDEFFPLCSCGNMIPLQRHLEHWRIGIHKLKTAIRRCASVMRETVISPPSGDASTAFFVIFANCEYVSSSSAQTENSSHGPVWG